MAPRFLSNETIRAWYISAASDAIYVDSKDKILESEFEHTVAVYGAGPLPLDAFCALLDEDGVEYVLMEDEPDAKVFELVVGRNDVDDQTLLAFVRANVEGFEAGDDLLLKVYSQEMFLFRMLTGIDPFLAPDGVLVWFGTGHSVLESLMETGFDWPSCEYSGPTTGGGLPNDDWPQVGMLKAMGYTVGESGIQDKKIRHQILHRVYTGSLRQVMSPSYMAAWGAPSSKQRLQKMANSIAAFVSLARKRPFLPDEAIRDWIKDLRWLHDTYYKGRYDGTFRWPLIQ